MMLTIVVFQFALSASAFFVPRTLEKGVRWPRSREGSVAASPPDWPSTVEGEQSTNDEASVLGAAGLVAGTTVGAGILALPQATLPAGYWPGCLVLVVSWLLMMISGLLVAETTTSTVCSTKRVGLGVLATSTETLGSTAGTIAGAAYALIHYALLVAYIAQGGALLAETPLLSSSSTVLQNGSGALFVAVFGSAVALGSSAFVERLNSIFVAVVAVSFVAIVALAAPEIEVSRLTAVQDNWGAAFAAAPICVLAGVYHNVIPVLVTRFKGDRDKLRTVIIGGSAAPTVMFLVWNTLICAAVDSSLVVGGDPVAQLRLNSADSAGLGACVSIFSLAAIVTSFFGFYFGLRTYVCDLLGIAEDPLDQTTKPEPFLETGINAAILLPPLLIASFNPDVFLSALDVAGTFGITTLFLIVPAATAWKQRATAAGFAYNDKVDGEKGEIVSVPPFAPGGNSLLAVVIFFASVIIAEGAYDKFVSYVTSG